MNNLRNLRKKKGYSIQKLHDLTGIPLRTLEDWDGEKRQIQAYHRIKMLAEVLDCTPDDLMRKKEYCMYGEYEAIIFLAQEEDGVHIHLWWNGELSHRNEFDTTIPREKALELLKYMKTHKDVKPFFEKGE